MAKLYFTNKAVEDLDSIWEYTVERWSRNQAEIYYNLLIDSCNELAQKPMQGKLYDVIDKNIYGFRSGQHLVFYQIISHNEIEVVRILHSMMDLKKHL